MIEDWIDALTKVWEVEDGKGSRVTAYRLFERDDIPETIPLDIPTALTFFDNVDFEYSQGGPSLAFWRGTVEFNLTPDLDKRRIPYVLRYIKRIMVAAAGNITLGNRVNYMILDPSASIEMTVLQYGNAGQEHLGLVAKWIVKETIQGLVVTG
ncbi:MAG: hypothetical protein CVU44_11330 [Chloroflexi bacterium HGW-Chloroflexi-6]|nr:MAG: hypothetical protein CVU44_11330 [Chloroflexi bacterium HGW-Chloroflexi-6]